MVFTVAFYKDQSTNHSSVFIFQKYWELDFICDYLKLTNPNNRTQMCNKPYDGQHEDEIQTQHVDETSFQTSYLYHSADIAGHKYFHRSQTAHSCRHCHKIKWHLLFNEHDTHCQNINNLFDKPLIKSLKLGNTKFVILKTTEHDDKLPIKVPYWM